MVYKEKIAALFPAVTNEPILRVNLNPGENQLSIPVYVSLFKINFEKDYTLTLALRRENGDFVTSRDFKILIPRSNKSGYIMSDNSINISGNFTMGGINLSHVKDGETLQILGNLRSQVGFDPEASALTYFEIRLK
jgi:hypothetical protein